MKKFILAMFLLGTSLLSHADVVPIVPGAPGVITQTMGDDGYAIVPLQFGFPFYGKTFTHSVMFDNGVVGLFDPTANIGCNPQVGWCGGQQWSAMSPSQNMGPQFSYMIAPLWADIAPNPATRYYTQGTVDYQKYMWENIHEYYSGGSRLNTFGLELTPNGSIDAWYSLINISTSNTFIGAIGDPMLGEWNTIGYYNFGTTLNQIPNWNIGGTGVNPCTADPLASPSCPGYAEAYLAQQCSISALYNPSCPGYALAYFNQQCSLNPLYNEMCPGYATAYLNYQCSIDPLYSTVCQGYEQAYYNQQCSINPLYHTGCEGYAQAYFSQQCSLNGLYDRTCPNYAEAYALTNIVVTQPKEPEPAKPVVTTSTTTSVVAVIADPVINNIVTSTSTTTSPAAAAPVVPLVAAPTTNPTTSNVTTAATTSESKTEDKKESTKTEAKSESKSESTTDSKPSQSSAREQMVAKRKEAAMQTAVRAGAEAAQKLDSATSMASQVAVQNVVIQAMGYNAAFQAYSYNMPDGNGYKPFTIYKNQKNVDNKRIGMELYGPSDKLHNELISSQYNREE